MRRAVSFGIPVEQAVLSATAIPARELGRQGELGLIADGLPADFVVCGIGFQLANGAHDGCGIVLGQY